MEPTDWIAIYAGLVATGTLIWQIIARSRDRRPRLTVYLSGMYHIEDATDTAAFVEYHEAENEPLPVPCSLEIEVTNIGRETVTVTNAAIEALVTANEAHNFAPSGELPWTLKRGDRESFGIEIAPGPIRKSTTFQAKVNAGDRRNLLLAAARGWRQRVARDSST